YGLVGGEVRLLLERAVGAARARRLALHGLARRGRCGPARASGAELERRGPHRSASAIWAAIRRARSDRRTPAGKRTSTIARSVTPLSRHSGTASASRRATSSAIARA